MFYSTVLIAATAFTGFVSAQNYSTSGPLTIDPNGITYATRLAWCRAQTTSCPQLCGGVAQPNTCDPNTLNYTCTCTNGNTPNITNYDQTIPSFICNAWIGNCVDNHPNDLVGITACRSVVCGMANASAVESGSGSSSSSASSSGSATASSTGTATGGAAGSATSGASSATSAAGSATSAAAASGPSAAASASSSASAAMANVAMNYGTGILATGLLAIFGLAL